MKSSILLFKKNTHIIPTVTFTAPACPGLASSKLLRQTTVYLTSGFRLFPRPDFSLSSFDSLHNNICGHRESHPPGGEYYSICTYCICSAFEPQYECINQKMVMQCYGRHFSTIFSEEVNKWKINVQSQYLIRAWKYELKSQWMKDFNLYYS